MLSGKEKYKRFFLCGKQSCEYLHNLIELVNFAQLNLKNRTICLNRLYIIAIIILSHNVQGKCGVPVYDRYYKSLPFVGVSSFALKKNNKKYQYVKNSDTD